MDRGVIAAPGIIRPLPQGFTMERSITPEELRYYVLYWDRVVIPGNNLINIGIPEEEAFIAAGAVSRPRIAFSGRFVGDEVTYALLSCQSIVAKTLVAQRDVDWVMHQIGDTVAIPREFGRESRTIRVAISNVLPVPRADVTVSELLEFKQRYRAELLELHGAMDELYLEVLRSPDPDLSAKSAVSRFRTAVEDLNKATVSRFKSARRFDLSAELNLDVQRIATGATAGAAAFSYFSSGHAIPLGAILGAAASLIRVTAKAGISLEAAQFNTKLAYLAAASKEAILPKT